MVIKKLRSLGLNVVRIVSTTLVAPRGRPANFKLAKLAPLYTVTRWVTFIWVIRSFRHKGLERFFSTGSKSGIQAQHAERLRVILGRLNVSVTPKDMNLPGLDLHPLKGRSQRDMGCKG